MIPYRSRKPKEIARAERTDPATGDVFDSASELRRWRELQAMEKIGAIADLRRQVVFPLYAATHLTSPVILRAVIKIRSPRYPKGRACIWTADFAYREKGVPIFEEHKGVWTEAARLRIAIAEACYGITVRITGPQKMVRGRRRAA